MAFEKLRPAGRSPPAPGGAMRVVPHRPVLRAFMLTLLALVVLSGVAFGYWLGRSTSNLERDYLVALETRERALQARLADLTRELADARLGQSVDGQAAASLRETISELRSRVGNLREEVTFYKSLMAPSSIERGLQIAELELARGEGANQFVYRLLLTQAEDRRDWVQGDIRLEVQGVRTGGGSSVEEVLPLTEVSEPESYPLKFRFRYFQNLTGTVTLPDDFRPQSVLVTLIPKGRSSDRAERTFDWNVQAG